MLAYTFQIYKSVYNERHIACYVIVYSITERSSFNFAVNLVNQVCALNGVAEKRSRRRSYAVVLVANKGDLVRKRQVSEAGNIYSISIHDPAGSTFWLY